MPERRRKWERPLRSQPASVVSGRKPLALGPGTAQPRRGVATRGTDVGTGLASGRRVVAAHRVEPRRAVSGPVVVARPEVDSVPGAREQAGTATFVEAVRQGRGNSVRGHRAEPGRADSGLVAVAPRELDPVLAHPGEPERARNASARAATGIVALAIGGRAVPKRGRAGSDRVVVARRQADSAVDPRVEPPRATSGPVAVVSGAAVVPREPDSVRGRRTELERATVDSRLAVLARSGMDSPADRRADPEQAGADSLPVIVDPSEADSAAGHHGEAHPPKAVSRLVVVAPSEPDSAPGLHAGAHRPKVVSRPVVVAPSEPDSAAGLHAAAHRPRVVSRPAIVASSERDPAAGLHAEAHRPKVVSGPVVVAPSEPDSAAGLHARAHRPKVVSGPAAVAPTEVSSGPGRRPGRARAASARAVAAPVRHAARVPGERASVAVHPDFGAVQVERGASEHCPAVAVHDDPAPARAVEVEVGGVAAGAEPAPASAG